MSDQSTENTGPTRPGKEHEWLKQLVGEWRVDNEMTMPDGQKATSTGRESVRDLGGMWAVGQGEVEMPGMGTMSYYTVLGYDVSYQEYRGCWFASVSSHLWKQAGKLSADGKTLTLDCEGPAMSRDGTANYRFVIEIQDNDHHTMTESGDESGDWQEFIKVKYTRA